MHTSEPPSGVGTRPVVSVVLFLLAGLSGVGGAGGVRDRKFLVHQLGTPNAQLGKPTPGYP